MALVLFVSALSLLSGSYAAPEVRLGNTTLIGREVTLLNQDFFGGIPYARPPVGSLRYHPPVLQLSLDTPTFDASNFGLACLQGGLPLDIISENCLTINVFRPSGISRRANLPVMAWIYGGAFLIGTSATYNGSGIVARSVARGTPIIYVSMNYRLGPLGFPQGQEALFSGALNLGLKDQLAALEWIKVNIGAFGGDRSKVTVFGQSAGAVSIGNLYLNSGLEELVRAAIFESGSAATLPVFPAYRREKTWQAYVSAVPGCEAVVNTTHTFTCLRSANASTILQAAIFATLTSGELSPWGPVIDGPSGLIPDLPSELWRTGSFSRIPFIAGTNLDEGTFFTPQTVNSTIEIEASILIGATPSPSGPVALNAAVGAIMQLYPDIPALGSPFNTGNETFGLSSQYKRSAAIFGDMSFQSQRRLWSQRAILNDVKTFGYLFTDPGSEEYKATEPAPGSLGVTHGQEILYVYGGLVNPTPTSALLSLRMMDYWISFATSLDPNDRFGSPRPLWPEYFSNNELLQLDGSNLIPIPDNYRENEIGFLIENKMVFNQ